ncbi:hypothetical protein QJS04_geneDACA023546 [Acorus gramineus]|uniref:Uncharacterized protein n=1 Tax=Acorus gramineus TaxID=55184 RepID=A0AAV9BMY3_ACOGR|nr:hypothetical protein QJS04_geneDACA023546 [Acorus gramineus]
MWASPNPHRRRSWRSTPSTPMKSTTKSKGTPDGAQKASAGNSPYVQAKRVQMVDKDLSKAVSLFWAAINNDDRVDSALKDMASVMKQLHRPEEAIEAIKSFRNLCSSQAQESLDNILLDLYKACDRIDDQIELMQYKLRMVNEGLAFGGLMSKQGRSQGKKVYISIDREKSRLMGNLAWAYMQNGNYKDAEEYYRKSLSMEPDPNKQCNLAICLLQAGNVTEAKSLLQEIRPSTNISETESFEKSFKRASRLLAEFESRSVSALARVGEGEEDQEIQSFPTLAGKSSIAANMNCVMVQSPYQENGGSIGFNEYSPLESEVYSNSEISAIGAALTELLVTKGEYDETPKPMPALDFLDCSSRKKSWADMVEEEEFLGGNNPNSKTVSGGEGYSDENLNVNIRTACSPQKYGSDRVHRKLDTHNVKADKDEFRNPCHSLTINNSNDSAIWSGRSRSLVRRSLVFDEQSKQGAQGILLTRKQ